MQASIRSILKITRIDRILAKRSAAKAMPKVEAAFRRAMGSFGCAPSAEQLAGLRADAERTALAHIRGEPMPQPKPIVRKDQAPRHIATDEEVAQANATNKKRIGFTDRATRREISEFYRSAISDARTAANDGKGSRVKLVSTNHRSPVCAAADGNKLDAQAVLDAIFDGSFEFPHVVQAEEEQYVCARMRLIAQPYIPPGPEGDFARWVEKLAEEHFGDHK